MDESVQMPAVTSGECPHEDSLSLTFLGSGDAFGSGGRFQTCMYLASDSARLLIDCGASSLIALKRAGVDPLGIDAVTVSHLHGDHFAGLPFLVLDARFSRRSAPLVVVGPPGLQARVEAAMEVLFPGSSTVSRPFEIEWIELDDRATATAGGAQIQAFHVIHPSGAPAAAQRITCDGAVITYSGDTEWTDALIDASQDADLFVCEAYFFEKRVKFHLDYRTLEQHLPRISARRLVITHMNSDMLRHVDDVPTEAAYDGLTVTLPTHNGR